MINNFLESGMEHMPHIFLTPTQPTHYYHYIIGNGFGDLFRPTSYVEYVEMDRVLAHTRKCNLG